ncbi:DegV family protein [Desulfurispora thermophila]|uniref:DegV family protein n=1 Tax=Desulfurispora thermophila TaxID=265470 RepID=UPI001FA6ECC6|nr:DegV family protein [Desulfurispora thermophila]
MAIVTDSTADLPAHLYKEHNITVVPLKVIFGQEMLLDGVEITPDRFFYRQAVLKEYSTTSQPSPAEFVAAYRPLLEAGGEVISLHISSRMSGTLQSARLAQSMLSSGHIEIIDSTRVSAALGLVVLNAARAAQRGAGRSEIMELISRQIRNLEVFFAVDTLEYLQRGGRIGRAQAFLGTLLNVKPILTMRDGYIHPFEKVRGKQKALQRMITAMQDRYGPGTSLQCVLVHGQDPQGLEELRQLVSQQLNCVEIIDCQLGCVVGSHVGPGVLGLVCLPLE